MKIDIENLDDIKRFVDLFYERIRDDDRLGPVFNDVAAVDWTTHLDTMYRFWDSVIFNAGSYQGNPLTAHLAVNEKLKSGDADRSGFKPADFDHWVELFVNTLDGLFTGPRTEFTKQSAARLARHLSNVFEKGYQPDPTSLARYQSRKAQANSIGPIGLGQGN